MQTIVINGDAWGVVRVPAGDPSLMDRTGSERLGVTDPWCRQIRIRADLVPPKLDQVVLHEVAHAITVSWDLLDGLHRAMVTYDKEYADEWAAQLVESHAIEAVRLTGEILGRPACVRGECL
jgi:hypothetical protein